MIKRTLKQSISNALKGIAFAFRTQRNMRIHSLAGILALCLATYLRLSLTNMAIIVLTVIVVMVSEMVNTAIECATDLQASDNFNPLVKVAKDVAAGAVWLSAIGAILIGILIFLPAILQRLQ